ncbi:MAG: hypothetical protein WDW38_002920 [Sanguina aurantia]
MIKKDPAAAAQMQAMQKAMEDPAMRAQMEQMASAMQNQALQAKLGQLKDDPEFAEMFEDLKTNGMQALMKYYNDPVWLAKLGSRLDGVAPEQPPQRPRPPPQAPPEEITSLLDAAKYEDDEAVEDFIAIGKDVNAADSEGRTPLHFAAGTNNEVIAVMLIEAGANLEGVDSKNNTPLHYAAGYGREEMTRLLLSRGAKTSARNGTGKTAVELVRAAPPNPLNREADLMAQLSK